MTDGRPPADWSDERLEAAFHVRASGRPTPVHLSSTTMDRVGRRTSERRTQPRLLWAGALAAVIAVAVIAGSTVTSRAPTPSASTVAASSPSPAATATAAASPKTIALQFTVGAHRVRVEVVDGSGRLIAARTTTMVDETGLEPNELRASAVDEKPDQLQIDWIGGACDGTLRLAITEDVRTVDATTVSGTLDGDMFCPLGGSPRGVVLTFDGPVAANEVAVVGDSPLPVLEPVGSTWVGEPISVAEAIQHRDDALDDTELAVAGWWYQSPLIHSCPLQLRPTSPIEPRCNDDLAKLVDVRPTNGLPAPTDGPELVPLLRDGINWGTFEPRPVTGDAVLVLGHFADHRSVRCPDRDMCERAFVVDAVLDPADPQLGPPATEDFDVETVATIDDVQGFGVHNPATTVLSAYATTGAFLTAVEPTASTSQELVAAPVVWVIRSLDLATPSDPRVVTTLVIDRQPSTLWMGAFTQAGDGFTKMTYQRSP